MAFIQNNSQEAYRRLLLAHRTCDTMWVMRSIARALHLQLDGDLRLSTDTRARRRKRVALLDEARRLAADPEDRAELLALRDELDEITPPWPAD